jgi:hypothetical protein
MTVPDKLRSPNQQCGATSHASSVTGQGQVTAA